MNEYIYLFTWENDPGEKMLIQSTCTPGEMQDIIDEKNLRINYSDNEDYPYMTDYEILEEILHEQNYTCRDVTPTEEFTFYY